MMRILICGDRHWTDYDSIFNFVKKDKDAHPNTAIIQGKSLKLNVSGGLRNSYLSVAFVPPELLIKLYYQKLEDASGNIKSYVVVEKRTIGRLKRMDNGSRLGDTDTNNIYSSNSKGHGFGGVPGSHKPCGGGCTFP